MRTLGAWRVVASAIIIVVLSGPACSQQASMRRAYERAGAPPPSFPSRSERRAIEALVREFWTAAQARDSIRIDALSSSRAPLEYVGAFFFGGSWLDVPYDHLDVLQPYKPASPSNHYVVQVTLPRQACPPQYGLKRQKEFVFEVIEAEGRFLVARVGSDPC